MPDFIHLMECANTGPACLVAQQSWTLWLVLAVSAGLGWWWAASDPERCRVIGGRLGRFGLGTMALCLIAIAGYFVFDPDVILGVEENPFIYGLWGISNFTFGIGLLMAIAGMGLRLGRKISRA